MYNTNINLSKNFNFREAIKSQVATRYGIRNIPPVEFIPNIRAVAVNILQKCRDHYGVPITPSSWYRSKELNALIGGSKQSQHVQGEAVDFEVIGVANYTLAKYIQDNLTFDQLILEYYDPDNESAGWVHCSYVVEEESDNRKDVLLFDGLKYQRSGL